MDEEWDVEAMLEESFAKHDKREGSSSPEKEKKKKSKKKKRSHSREKDEKSSHKDKKRSRSENKDHRSPVHDRNKSPPVHSKDYRSRSVERRRSSGNSYSRHDGGGGWRRGGSRDHHNRFGRENGRRRRSRSHERWPSSKSKRSSSSPKKDDKGHDYSGDFGKPSRLHRNPDLTPEERDMRTIFCMQLSQRVRVRDLEEFFLPVGKVQDVRIIMDNKTRRSKGIAYVEFHDTFSVSLAMGLSGKKLLGVPIIVQLTQAEKNRAAASAMTVQRGTNTGPMRLYVGSLHFNITEDMLKGIFEPFGK